jgi:hypothetical protein
MCGEVGRWRDEHTGLESELLLSAEFLERGQFAVTPDPVPSMAERDGPRARALQWVLRSSPAQDDRAGEALAFCAAIGAWNDRGGSLLLYDGGHPGGCRRSGISSEVPVSSR